MDKIIHDTEKRLADKGIHISLTNQAKEKIIDESFDSNFGARPIKRYVQRNIESLIANAIVQDKIHFNSSIMIDVSHDKFIIK